MDTKDITPDSEKIVLPRHETDQKNIPQKSPQAKGSGHDGNDKDAVNMNNCLDS